MYIYDSYILILKTKSYFYSFLFFSFFFRQILTVNILPPLLNRAHKELVSHSFLFFPFFLTDIDECKTHPGKCHTNAICNNTHGSHVCTCKPGYNGDGHNCKGTVNILPPLLNRAHKGLVSHSFLFFSFFFCDRY